MNIPTSGAEIGGAFGGEKATGGGRESGEGERDGEYFKIWALILKIAIKRELKGARVSKERAREHLKERLKRAPNKRGLKSGPVPGPKVLFF